MPMLWPFCAENNSEICFGRAKNNPDSKSGGVVSYVLVTATTLQVQERLKRGFATYLGLAKQEFTQGD
jgi:hypothetical protein